MTTAEKLAEVTAQIRKDIPRLMEFKEGFIIENNSTQVKLLFPNYDFDFEKECNVHLFENTETFWYLTDEDLKECKFIGHDIMLNDVLEWLGKVLKEATEYRIGYTNIGKFGVKYREMLGVMDLSKPLLKDQSEYFIKFLYEFKNEHFKI
ncbi:hypothetical protein QIU18_13185 [Capnocytophaga canimorsus]|nr:hypothetical protein [Capnocytophaga canimorsus]WGU68522.1 hypothetical protein QIU19_00370 [Capnocytophaga canimorsus]WGU70372.1 hypothetical protein QIU18_13185 [Capnocytophaga canimorsus]